MSYTADQDETIRDMHKQRERIADIARAVGKSPCSVEWRLVVLGLRASPAWRKKEPTGTKRECLRCHEQFNSTWIGNRLCETCRQRVNEQSNALI